MFTPPLFSVVKTVKEASAVCMSFLDGVVIFLMVSRSLLFAHINGTSSKVENIVVCVVEKKLDPRGNNSHHLRSHYGILLSSTSTQLNSIQFKSIGVEIALIPISPATHPKK